MAKRSTGRRVGRAAPNRDAITRAEFDRVIELIAELQKTQEIQFRRVAQLQAELDLIRRAWKKLTLHP